MREKHPNGGVSDRCHDIREAGYISTSELIKNIGIYLPCHFIVDALGVLPEKTFVNRKGYYWDKKQIGVVRRALIKKLINDEFHENQDMPTMQVNKDN